MRMLASGFAAVLALTGCAQMVTQKYIDKYVGHPIDDAIAVHGQPSAVTPLPTGGKVYQWYDYSGTRETASAYATSGYAAGSGSTRVQDCALRFRTDDKGIIRETHWSGWDCNGL